MKILKILTTIASLFLSLQAQNIQDTSLGLRKSSVFDENVVPDKTNYSTKAAGESQKFDRAFENAPPFIPHDTEGLIPITSEMNACLDCHMPEVAPDVGSTPIPKTHFTNYRNKVALDKNKQITYDGKLVKNTAEVKLVSKPLDHLNPARYNCTQCHTPQSSGQLVENTFKADFRDKNSISSSNLLQNINEGVKW